MENKDNGFVVWFKDVAIQDIARVGGKNASLGEMIRELSGEGILIPSGFAVTAKAYEYFGEFNGLDQIGREILRDLDVNDIENLQLRGRRIRHAILQADIPPDLIKKITEFYSQLVGKADQPIAVAVRSSATAEDLPDTSFAGQLETFLNVQGETALLEACKRSFASLFTDRAISYRTEKGFDHFKVALSIGIQRMVRSDLASAGVMFTIDTESGFKDVVMINSSWGLGESVVQGSVNPDEFIVFKPTLEKGYKSILRRSLGQKEFKIIYDPAGTKGVQTKPVPIEDRIRYSLSDEEILKLAEWACKIEKHYTTKLGRYTPMDIEWAKDGETGQLYIVQARPETVQSQRKLDTLEVFKLDQRGPVIVNGRSVGMKIAKGKARIIDQEKNLGEIQSGEILVADKTDPDWEPAMKKVSAIVTNRGGRTCHAAIVSRELGLPAVIGTLDATSKISTGQEITVSCAEGEQGFVYDGLLNFTVEKTNLKDIPSPQTKILMNISNPDEAFKLCMLPNEGVGLARLEFIIGSMIKIHPLALLEYESLPDKNLRLEIEKLTPGYKDKTAYFVDKLAEGVGIIAAAFYPKDVIVRFSDFKSNEYANLIGGSLFEPKEENPMLGFRGASRYYDPKYRKGFALECLAMKRVREEMGLRNVKLMIPFCRTLEEGRKVLAELEVNGLRRGAQELEVYVMCEIPSNVILADQFADIFDGFSIGSNDLTQLVLGVDRDSELVASVFDERNPAVKQMISSVIKVAKDRGKKIGICGQAPSDYPDFAKFLVDQKIDSISLNPDAILKTLFAISNLEKSQPKEVQNVKKSRRGSPIANEKTGEIQG